ncbi:hypothetical protein LguiA_000790 [Lonicera macranthoides]
MSEPPNTSTGISTVVPYPHPHPHHQHQHLNRQVLPIHGGATTITTNIPGSGSGSGSGSSSVFRDYRKGNWTLEETLVLITAKKLNDERCSSSRSSSAVAASTDPTSPNTSRPTGELKWKWVENYCWANGCLRSQNQCNDKWDNLLRDYKKVREYDLRSSQSDHPSYWAMDRQQRKDQNLPSNLAPQIYEALNNVVQRKYQQRPTTTPTQMQQPITVHPTAPAPPPAAVVPPPPASEASDTSDSETECSEEQDGDTKRRKVRGIGSSIIRGASVLARSIRSSEEKKEKRHRELMELEERRIRAEESRNEVNRQGIASFVNAVNNLSGAIQSLISDPNHQP